MYEHWDWNKTDEYAKAEEDSAHGTILIVWSKSSGTPSVSAGDCLVMKTQCVFPDRHVHGMKTYWDGTHALLFLLYRQGSECGSAYIEVRGERTRTLRVPEYLEGSLLLKVSTTYLTLASENGYVYVMRIDPTSDDVLLHSHYSSLQLRLIRNLVLSNAGREIGNQISDDELVVKTAVFEKEPVFDLVGSWLVYCPTKKEVQYHEQMYLSEGGLAVRHAQAPQELPTPVRLPLSGPLLNRALSSVSNTAADKLFKLSDMGSKTVRSYLKKKDKIIDKDVSLHSISSSIGGVFLSTVDKIKKQAVTFGSHDYVRVMDLENGHTMALFKPPGGVSHLSLSPYDLHLVHANLKGDRLYMWDLCKLPIEVSIVGKFVRGKTSASIRDLVWFFNDNNSEAPSGTNFGFGVITKRSGSVHWYNVNYLSGGNEASNTPNAFSGGAAAMAYKNQFADSWILPSAKAVKFCKLPGLANVPAEISLAPHCGPMWAKRRNRLLQLAFIDASDNMRLISPLNGSYNFKYVLHSAPVDVSKFKTRSEKHSWVPQFAPETSSTNESSDDTPLSQAEIETCEPFLSLINDKSCEFTTYDLGEHSDKKFYELFLEFGMPITERLQRMNLQGDLELASGTSDNENLTSYAMTHSISSNSDMNGCTCFDPSPADGQCPKEKCP